ncbi:MAG TPA: hypothetical protein VF172_11885 [Nitrososphaera sp.]
MATQRISYYSIRVERGVSPCDPGSLPRNKIEAAFSAIFGRTAAVIMMEKSSSETKSA